MRPVHCAVLLSAALALPAAAKLPAPSEEAKAAAAETTSRAAWADKVGAYKLCLSQDKVAAGYRKTAMAAGKDVNAVQTAAPASGAAPAPVAIAGCTDPGPYVPSTPVASKPLEAAGAHSPAGTATSPPSTNATSSQMTPAPKK
jgi:hypothetical protein